jgi:hypothetical protein
MAEGAGGRGAKGTSFELRASRGKLASPEPCPWCVRFAIQVSVGAAGAAARQRCARGHRRWGAISALGRCCGRSASLRAARTKAAGSHGPAPARAKEPRGMISGITLHGSGPGNGKPAQSPTFPNKGSSLGPLRRMVPPWEGGPRPSPVRRDGTTFPREGSRRMGGDLGHLVGRPRGSEGFSRWERPPSHRDGRGAREGCPPSPFLRVSFHQQLPVLPHT